MGALGGGVGVGENSAVPKNRAGTRPAPTINSVATRRGTACRALLHQELLPTQLIAPQHPNFSEKKTFSFIFAFFLKNLTG